MSHLPCKWNKVRSFFLYKIQDGRKKYLCPLRKYESWCCRVTMRVNARIKVVVVLEMLKMLNFYIWGSKPGFSHFKIHNYLELEMVIAPNNFSYCIQTIVSKLRNLYTCQQKRWDMGETWKSVDPIQI